MNKSNLKEPLVRIVKRDNIKVKNIILIYSIAIIGGLLLSGFISMLFSDKGLFDFFQSLFEGALAANANFGFYFRIQLCCLAHQWHCFLLLK